MKTITLEQFVKKTGSQEHAAHKIGVTLRTVARWLKGEDRPGPLATEKLESMGIRPPGR